MWSTVGNPSTPLGSLSEKLLYWFRTLRLPIIFPVKASFSVTFCKGKPQDFFQWTIEQVFCTFSFLSLSIGADSSNGLTCCHSDITGCVQSLCVGTEVSFSSKGTWGSSITWILLCYYNCTDDSSWTVTKSSKGVNKNSKSWKILAAVHSMGKFHFVIMWGKTLGSGWPLFLIWQSSYSTMDKPVGLGWISRNGSQQDFAHDTLILAKSFSLKQLPKLFNHYTFTYSHPS